MDNKETKSSIHMDNKELKAPSTWTTRNSNQNMNNNNTNNNMNNNMNNTNDATTTT